MAKRIFVVAPDMSETRELLPLYLHLARAGEKRNRPAERDKLLVLAGVTAAERGLDLIAAFCRRTVLANNPGHLVGHHPTLAAALDDERFQGYLTQLRRRYTRERVEHMLGSLGIDLAHEGQAYFTLHEYAAALLGTTPAELDALFGDLDEADDDVATRPVAHRAPPRDDTKDHELARHTPRGVLTVLVLAGLLSLGAAALGVARWLVR